MITRMLAGKRNRICGPTYCIVTDTCCFNEITTPTQPTCITFYVYNDCQYICSMTVIHGMYCHVHSGATKTQMQHYMFIVSTCKCDFNIAK